LFVYSALPQRRRDSIVSHKFAVGQIVTLAPRVLQAAAQGRYEVRQLMPASDGDADPVYRIKSIDEKQERVAAESDLTPAT
jgi:hypothetical protein